MASILRTGKFLRYFAGFTRNVVVNSVRESDSCSLLQTSPCLCNTNLLQGYATAAKPDVSLEKQLRRLDQDARRIGRISRRDIEEVLEEIRVQRTATSSQSLLVIRCCGNLVPEEMPEVRTALVQEIWKTLNALNVAMDISHYNALLRVYLENEHPFSPTDFLSEIESKSIEPNRVTYQRLIARYCQQGDIDGATRILEFMQTKKLPVNENVFNSLILGHSQANDMESAKGILAVMQQAGIEPSAETYSTLLSCFARHGDLESIMSTLDECESKEIFLLDKDILDVVYNLSINGHEAKVDAVLGKLRYATGFNQDAVNVILSLINRGHEDVGLKILRVMPRSTRADGNPADVGNFFIKQLVKANRPVDKILSICKILQDEGLNPKALLMATEAGLTHGLVNNALPLLKEMKNAGLPIRQHYFWPLICSVESNQVIDILRRMQEEFSINPNSETIRDYVIPNLKEKNWNKIVTLLRDAGISSGTAVASAAYSALSMNQLKDAANIMETNKAHYIPQLFRQPLISALNKTYDYDATIRVLRQIFEGLIYRQSNNDSSIQKNAEVEADAEDVAATEAETSSSNGSIPDAIGLFLLETCAYFRKDRVAVLENLLNGLVQQGLSISSVNAMRISDRIGSEMTPQLSELLGKLSSGELQPVPIKNTESRKRGLEELTADELERFIANIEAKGENTNNLKRHLIASCIRSKNIERTLQTIDKLEAEGKFVINSGIWAQVVELYVHHGKSDEALQLYEKIKAKESEFLLDNMKTIKFVEMLLKEDRLDDAIKFLERNKKPELFAEGEGSFNYMTTVWRLLNLLAEKGNAQQLQLVFDELVKGNYFMPNNVVLGPLIKVHLVNDNIAQAIEAFEAICGKYKSTPYKNELACRLIQNEDATNLQKLTDLSTIIHGEVNSLYDLVFAFVECGRVRQARKILETPGLRSRPHRIDTACERYKNEGMVVPLEGLVEATKDLNHIDRNKIYYNLLLSYNKSNDADKALGLWTKMQEENVAPTDAFLIKLAELLRRNKNEIPFIVPETNKAKNEAAAKSVANSVKTEKIKEPKAPKPPKGTNATPAAQPSTMALFRKAMQSGDVDTALNYKSQLNSTESTNLIDTSRLIEQLLRVDRISEATVLVNEMLAQQRYPLPKIFKFYLNKISNSGDVATMKKIGDQLNDEQKRMVSFDNRFCHANIVAGNVEQYFKTMTEEIDSVKTTEEAAKLAEKFPRGGAMGILEKYPEMVPQFEILAEKYAQHNQLGPINVLWMHLISEGNQSASKVIWDKHLSSAPRLMFQRVLQTAREQKDDKLVESVIAQLRGSKISEGAIGNAYSCLIDIQMGKENYDNALVTLNTAMKDVCLENINRTALLRLKAGLESQKKEFPYTIPEKKTKNQHSSSSSSASSDDDVQPERPETRPTKPTGSA